MRKTIQKQMRSSTNRKYEKELNRILNLKHTMTTLMDAIESLTPNWTKQKKKKISEFLDGSFEVTQRSKRKE